MRQSQRGQILLVTAASLVVLLAISALVIDLGFSWMLRRQEQNAADPAALAAARYIGDPLPSGVQPFDTANGTQAACYYAQQNGFFVEDASCASALSAGNLKVNYPPDGTAGNFAGMSGHVQVVITSDHDAFFGRILGQSKTTVRTQAVAARERGTANSTSIYVKSPHDCPAMGVSGNAFIHVYPAAGVTDPGGFVHVESDCGAPYNSNDACSNGTGALKIDGTNANLYAPKVEVVGSCQTTQSDEPHGILDEAASPLGDPLAALRFPALSPSAPGATCGVGGPQTTSTGPTAKGCGNNPMGWATTPCGGSNCVTLDPGIYYGGWKIGPHLKVNLHAGIYIIAGGGISLTADGSLDSLDGSGAPAPVLIFNTDNPAKSGCPINNNAGCQQGLDLTAGTSLKIAGLRGDEACPPATTDPDPSDPDDDGCPFGGMVIWYDQFGSQSAARSGIIDIEGGTELFISGTVYAPYATVNLLGNGSTNTSTPECPVGATQIAAIQIVSWILNVGGTGDLCMPYDPSKLYHRNNQGLVH